MESCTLFFLFDSLIKNIFLFQSYSLYRSIFSLWVLLCSSHLTVFRVIAATIHRDIRKPNTPVSHTFRLTSPVAILTRDFIWMFFLHRMSRPSHNAFCLSFFPDMFSVSFVLSTRNKVSKFDHARQKIDNHHFHSLWNSAVALHARVGFRWDTLWKGKWRKLCKLLLWRERVWCKWDSKWIRRSP